MGKLISSTCQKTKHDIYEYAFAVPIIAVATTINYSLQVPPSAWHERSVYDDFCPNTYLFSG